METIWKNQMEMLRIQTVNGDEEWSLSRIFVIKTCFEGQSSTKPVNTTPIRCAEMRNPWKIISPQFKFEWLYNGSTDSQTITVI